MSKIKIKLMKSILSIVLTMTLIINSFIVPVHATGVVSDNLQNTFKISSANDFPKEIKKDQVYILTNDITLNTGQQIENLEGTLDGKGFKITLADKPLAKNVSGTIQNIGINSAGTIESKDTFGSMAVTLSGTIQNSYSVASIKLSGWMGEVGGLVGTLSSGTIKNSYFAGTIDSMLYGGLVGINNSANSMLSNCYYTVNATGPVSMAYPKPQQVNCDKKTKDELKSSEGVSLLNTSLPDTGFIWTSSEGGDNDGLPTLKEGKLQPPSDKVEKTKLENYINQVKDLETKKDQYTEESWNALQQVLKDAEAIFEKDDATQSEVDEQAKKLSDSINALKKKKVTSPVALPENPKDIKHINSVEDLKKIDVSDKNAFYVLDKDIVIDSNDWYFPIGEFEGTLDGQGHTVTFKNADGGIFNILGESGIIQNIYFTGSFGGWDALGPITVEVKGSIINCYSDVTGSNASGFAKRLNGGVLSNCYSVSEGKKGVLFNQYKSGSVINSYWSKTSQNQIEIPSKDLINSKPMTEEEMKSIDFTNLLNHNRGKYGVKWGQSSTGYPYFGENQEYNPDDSDLPENKYKVIFESYNGEEIEIDNQVIHLSPDFVDSIFKGAGEFKIVDLPEGSTIEWSINEIKPKDCMLIGSDNGDLRIDAEGTAIVTATEIKANGERQTVANIKVIANSKNIEEIKLFIDGNDVTNGKYTIAGSEWKDIKVKARYEGSDEYVPVVYSRFNYEADNEDMVYNMAGSRSFCFKKAGTASIKVTSVKDSNITAKVEVTSTYVPVESIEQTIPSLIEIHGRNANSSIIGAFNPQYYGVVVKPENASNRNNYTIESSDPTVGEYVSSMVNGYVPYKAGTTTYKISLTDINPDTNEKRVLTSSKKTTYTYLNPLTRVTVKNDTIEMNNNTESDIDLTFVGERSDEGYSVTAPELIWTYDKEGIVEIERRTNGFWKKNTDEYDKAPDKGFYISGSDYYITALSEGTVTAIGTPADNTNNVEPVKITITVKPGDVEPVDINKLVTQGVEGAIEFINKNYKDGYSYGDEWLIYSLLHAGETIEKDKLDAYYNSVVKEVKTWSDAKKPTDIERVALSLSILGKDITNIEGVNLAEMIYNSKNLKNGSNELAYALLALDAKNTTIPDTALWTREEMISELLKFQNPQTGGFGLIDNKTTSVDITAMVLQALAKYKDYNEEVNASVEKALRYLKAEMSSKYDFGTPESSAQVLLALSILEIDPLSQDEGFGTRYRNIITRLMDYFDQETGGFTRNPGDKKPIEMTTMQALQGLSSYKGYVNGEKPYWDLTDKLENDGDGSKPEESNKPPVITASDVELYVGDTFDERKNVTAYDKEGRDITEKLEIVENTVDTSNAGVYKVVYKVVDKNNNEAIKEIKVTVKEKNQDSQEQFIKIGVYTDKEAIYESLEVEYKENDTAYTVLKRLFGDKVIASGKNDNLYVSSINGLGEMDKGPQSGWIYSVNRVTPEVSAGSYKLSPDDELIWHYTLNLGKDITNSYEKFDEFKNKYDSEHPLPPIENKAPVINAKDIEIKVGDTFDPMKNVTATDKEGKDLTSKIKVIKNTVNTNKAGNYEVIYEVSDTKGLKTIKTITVTVTEIVNKVDVSKVKSNTENWILSNLKNPGYGDEWKIFALAKGNTNVPSDLYKTYYKNLVNKLKEKNGVLHRTKYTEYSRAIITLTALGYDPTYVGGYNLVEKLYNYDNVSKQGINGLIFALIALDSNEFEIKGNENSREMLINGILSKQLTDGGFNLSGTTGDVDITAMAIQALAKYKNQPRVKSALDKAINFLSKAQLSTGGFGTSEGETSESSAQVLIALTTLGIDINDSRFIKDGNSIIDAIMRFKLENGGFKHLLSQVEANDIATEQVLLALVSIERASNGKTSLYDMSDVDLRNPETGEDKDNGGNSGSNENQDNDKNQGNNENADKTENNSPETLDKSILPFIISATLAMVAIVVLNRRKLD